MFRNMRRSRQQLPENEVRSILESADTGVLAVNGDDGYPYAVPLNYVYANGRIYFHCAKEGHKIDALRRDPKVSFCVVDADDVIAEKYTTGYRSVIAFGRARIMEDEGQVFSAIEALAKKYVPMGSEAERRAEISGGMPKMAMVEIEIEHVSGKEGLELSKMHRGR